MLVLFEDVHIMYTFTQYDKWLCTFFRPNVDIMMQKLLAKY